MLLLINPLIAGKPFRDSFEWHSERCTRVHVVHRRTGETIPVIYEACPLFTFHHANAYEKDGCLVVDFCKIEDPSGIFSSLGIDEMRQSGGKTHVSRIRRLTYADLMLFDQDYAE